MATAPRVDVWLCLEYAGAWGGKALKESDLPEPVQAHLAGAESAIPNARVELIKQEGRRPSRDYAFFVAVSHEIDPILYRFTLKTYDDVLGLDLANIAALDPAHDPQRVAETLILTCANGKRDPCCARNGLPVYHALMKRAGERVWQCTHLGGHRFAANVVALPSGTYYGRATPGDVAELLDPSSIDLGHYRGRSCYDEPVQAADALLRARSGETALDAYRLESIKPVAEDQWSVRFAHNEDSFTVNLARESAGMATYDSCSKTEKSEVKVYREVDSRTG